LTVVVPAFNEVDGLPRLVAEVDRLRDRLVTADGLEALDLVVVDDGSTDGTGDEAEARAETIPWLQVVRHAQNRGIGAAIRTGIAASTGDLVLYVDADLPVDLGAAETALRLAAGAEGPTVVSAHRAERRPDGVHRAVYSWLWHRALRIVVGLRARDVNFAFKLLPGPEVRDLDLRSEGPFIDAEILLRLGTPLQQFAAAYRPRRTGRSTAASARAIRQAVAELWRVGRSLRGHTPP